MASINDLAAAAVATSTSTSGPAANIPMNQAPPRQLPSISTAIAMSATSDAAAEGARSGVRGALIALEGLDRSGKTTQVKLLEQRFVELGKRVKVMRFPGRLLSSIYLIQNDA